MLHHSYLVYSKTSIIYDRLVILQHATFLWELQRLNMKGDCMSGHFHYTVQGRICIGYTSSTSAKTVFVLVEINRPQHYPCVKGPQLEVKYLTICLFCKILSTTTKIISLLISHLLYNDLSYCFSIVWSNNVFSNQHFNNSNICRHPSRLLSGTYCI